MNYAHIHTHPRTHTWRSTHKWIFDVSNESDENKHAIRHRFDPPEEFPFIYFIHKLYESQSLSQITKRRYDEEPDVLEAGWRTMTKMSSAGTAMNRISKKLFGERQSTESSMWVQTPENCAAIEMIIWFASKSICHTHTLARTQPHTHRNMTNQNFIKKYQVTNSFHSGSRTGRPTHGPKQSKNSIPLRLQWRKCCRAMNYIHTDSR